MKNEKAEMKKVVRSITKRIAQQSSCVYLYLVYSCLVYSSTKK